MNDLHKLNNIILIGLMGTGKTTISKALLKYYSGINIDYKLLDTDSSIIQQTELTIQDIFEQYGEEYFRQLEHKLIVELLNKQYNHAIIATGGGLPIAINNHANLKSLGLIVWLKATPECLFNRLKQDNNINRPLLSKSDDKILENLQQLALVRDSVYNDLADIVIHTDNKSPELITEEIINNIR